MAILQIWEFTTKGKLQKNKISSSIIYVGMHSLGIIIKTGFEKSVLLERNMFFGKKFFFSMGSIPPNFILLCNVRCKS